MKAAITKKATKIRSKTPQKPRKKKFKASTLKAMTDKPYRKRRFEGASKAKRLGRWIAPGSNANDAVATGLVTLRNRSRDLRRNNPYAAKGIQVITSNVVGFGVSTQFRGASAMPLEDLWAKWAETTAIDFDGRNNIYGLQRMVMDAVVESGEVLVRKRYTADLDFPLQYQILESDFLDIDRNEETNDGNSIVQGVEVDPQGRRVAYWLFEEHPGNSSGFVLRGQKESVRITADQVRHIFRPDRPGQLRGIPWLAPVIVRLKDLDDAEDANLVRQKTAACFTAFVRDAFSDFDGTDSGAESIGERLEPGIIEHLPAGKTIEFTNPPNYAGFGDYMVGVLRGIACGLGITYESLTSDLSQVNFSSARMGWIEMGRNLHAWRENIMNAHFLDGVANDFLFTAAILGYTTDVNFVHVPPKREMIDPTKEIPAIIEAIQGGLTTLSDEIMSQGKDPKDHFQKYAEDRDTLDALGLVLKSDFRNQVKAGTPTSQPNQGDTTNETQNQASGARHSSGIHAGNVQRGTKYN